MSTYDSSFTPALRAFLRGLPVVDESDAFSRAIEAKVLESRSSSTARAVLREFCSAHADGKLPVPDPIHLYQAIEFHLPKNPELALSLEMKSYVSRILDRWAALQKLATMACMEQLALHYQELDERSRAGDALKALYGESLARLDELARHLNQIHRDHARAFNRQTNPLAGRRSISSLLHEFRRQLRSWGLPTAVAALVGVLGYCLWRL